MTNEHFIKHLPVAANLGSLAGIVAVRLSGVKAIGVLGSRFNVGFNAMYIGQYVGAAAGVIAWTMRAKMQEDEEVA